jgi:3-hydroxyacyl-[acyl-carrier-protein] dehydratase
MSKLFILESRNEEQGRITANYHLDAQNPIFEGHFPNNPIVPGVCQINQIKEDVQGIVGKALQLKEIVLAKYFKPMVPSSVCQLVCTVTEHEHYWHVQAQWFDRTDQSAFSKFTLKFETKP